MKLVNIKYIQCINVYSMWLYTCTCNCDVVYSTYIGTCSYVIVLYLIMNDNILTAAIMIQGDLTWSSY